MIEDEVFVKPLKILNNDLFYNDDNLSYLKAIVELHSIDDSNNEKIFHEYTFKMLTTKIIGI